MLLDSALLEWGTREDLHLSVSLALITRGIKPVLVFSEAPFEELKDKFRIHGIEVLELKYSDGLLRYYRGLRKIVKAHGITSAHVAFFTYFSLVSWLARLSGVRWIVYQERNPGTLRAAGWKRFLLRLRTRLAVRPVSHVIAISDFVRRRMIDVGVPECITSVAHHGIDRQHYLPCPASREQLNAQFGIRPGELVLATLCYMKRHKNIDVVLQACSLLKRRGLLLRFLALGEGPMLTELREIGDKLGLSDSVHWLGHIPDPVPVLQGCDVFLMVSSGEGFGLAAAEAMACGAAVIAADSGALPEVVEDGVTGLLVPPGDANALADAVWRLAQDGSLRTKLARNSIERVQRQFAIENSIDKIMAVYESLWSVKPSV